MSFRDHSVKANSRETHKSNEMKKKKSAAAFQTTFRQVHLNFWVFRHLFKWNNILGCAKVSACEILFCGLCYSVPYGSNSLVKEERRNWNEVSLNAIVLSILLSTTKEGMLWIRHFHTTHVDLIHSTTTKGKK